MRLHLEPNKSIRSTLGHNREATVSSKTQALLHMEGGDTGVHEAMRRAWAEASYWLSGMSVAVGAPSYRGDPEEEEAEAGWVRGAGCVEELRKNGVPSPLDTPAICALGVVVPLLTDHRLGYWLQRKSGETQTGGRQRRGARPCALAHNLSMRCLSNVHLLLGDHTQV